MTDRGTNDETDSPPDEGNLSDLAIVDDDAQSDFGQAVEARADALKRINAGDEPEFLRSRGTPDGAGCTGGGVKNQDDDAQ